MSRDPEKLRRRTSPECLSDFQLDCLLSENNPHQSSAVSKHLRDCSSCAQKLRLRRESISAFNTDFDLAALSTQMEKRLGAQRKNKHRLWLRRFLILAPAATTILVLVVVLALPAHHQSTNGVNRVKGAPGFGVTVKRNQTVFSGENGGVYYAGDQLVFHVETAKESFFSLFNLEQSGRVTRFAPTQGSQSIHIPTGQKYPLPQGIQLDDSTGMEYLVGIFCPQNYDLQTIHRALKDWDRQPNSLRAIVITTLYSDCTHALFRMTKIRDMPEKPTAADQPIP